MNKSQKTRHQGSILIVTIWICLFLAGLVLVAARSARVQAMATANRLAGAQAEWIARGALALVLSQIDGTDGRRRVGEEINWEAVPSGPGYFWLLKPDLEDEHQYAFGVMDEAAKINLNAADEDMMLKLPGMTEELAAAIIDWRSSQPAASSQLAGDEYYLLLKPPYYCKRAPLETVEELLLLKGASLFILFGEDINRNGFLDLTENNGEEAPPSDNADNHLDRGLYPFVTVVSSQANVTLSQEHLIDVNSTDTTELVSLLQSVVSSERLFSVLERVRRGRPFRSTLDFFFRAGLSVEEFKKVEPRITVGRRARQVGLVNLVTACRQVIACLPGLEEADVEALINKRQAPDTDLTSLAWVAETLPGEKAAAIGEWVTTRSFQFSADIVAVSSDGRAFKRYRAIIDGRSRPPRVLSFQDLTGLGWPLSREILTALRSGKTLLQPELTTGTGGNR
ncbi:MAG TPA: type II secretion system protein GspK [bacterium]|nr:type II secretion system protein GspK [bacterium]HPP11210.1 type II secretion system protein GspK [bacterium]